MSCVSCDSGESPRSIAVPIYDIINPQNNKILVMSMKKYESLGSPRYLMPREYEDITTKTKKET